MVKEKKAESNAKVSKTEVDKKKAELIELIKKCGVIKKIPGDVDVRTLDNM